jgi:hypothetical protein
LIPSLHRFSSASQQTTYLIEEIEDADHFPASNPLQYNSLGPLVTSVLEESVHPYNHVRTQPGVIWDIDDEESVTEDQSNDREDEWGDIEEEPSDEEDGEDDEGSVEGNEQNRS